MPQLSSLRPPAWELQLLKPSTPSRRPASCKSPQRGAARHNSRGALLATPGEAHAQPRRLSTARDTRMHLFKPHRWRSQCDRLGQRDSPGEGPALLEKGHTFLYTFSTVLCHRAHQQRSVCKRGPVLRPTPSHVGTCFATMQSPSSPA